MFAGKPIIGITGGIGSGKSYVAGLFAELGCVVVDSDAQAKAAFEDPAVRKMLQQWWGAEVAPDELPVDRKAIAKIVFGDEQQRIRLERLIHPWVEKAKDVQMQAAVGADPDLAAFIWDTPLLCEAGLHRQCDAVVFVDADEATRQERVRMGRGWDEAEMARREKFQWPLDKKREIADYVICNTTGAEDVRVQVREMLSRILVNSQRNPAK